MARTLGQRVTALRRAKNWTQKDLADAVKRLNPDFSGAQSTIQAIEGGQSKRPTIIWEIAEALGTTVDFLRFGRGEDGGLNLKNSDTKYTPPSLRRVGRLLENKDSLPEPINHSIQSKTFKKLNENDLISNILEAVHGSYLVLGLSEELSEALVELVLEVAEEPPIPGVQGDGPVARRLLAASATRRFLKTKQL